MGNIGRLGLAALLAGTVSLGGCTDKGNDPKEKYGTLSGRVMVPTIISDTLFVNPYYNEVHEDTLGAIGYKDAIVKVVGTNKEVFTDSAGFYFLDSLPEGNYQVVAVDEGLKYGPDTLEASVVEGMSDSLPDHKLPLSEGMIGYGNVVWKNTQYYQNGSRAWVYLYFLRASEDSTQPLGYRPASSYNTLWTRDGKFALSMKKEKPFFILSQFNNQSGSLKVFINGEDTGGLFIPPDSTGLYNFNLEVTETR